MKFVFLDRNFASSPTLLLTLAKLFKYWGGLFFYLLDLDVLSKVISLIAVWPNCGNYNLLTRCTITTVWFSGEGSFFGWLVFGESSWVGCISEWKQMELQMFYLNSETYYKHLIKLAIGYMKIMLKF